MPSSCEFFGGKGNVSAFQRVLNVLNLGSFNGFFLITGSFTSDCFGVFSAE